MSFMQIHQRCIFRCFSLAQVSGRQVGLSIAGTRFFTSTLRSPGPKKPKDSPLRIDPNVWLLPSESTKGNTKSRDRPQGRDRDPVIRSENASVSSAKDILIEKAQANENSARSSDSQSRVVVEEAKSASIEERRRIPETPQTEPKQSVASEAAPASSKRAQLLNRLNASRRRRGRTTINAEILKSLRADKNINRPPQVPARVEKSVEIPGSPGWMKSQGWDEFSLKDQMELQQEQEDVRKNRTNFRRPATFAFALIPVIYLSLAFWDSRSSDTDSNLAPRQPVAQSWFTTPSVIRQCLKTTWDELDPLTVGLIAAMVAVQVCRFTPIPLWEELMHIAGEKRYTLMTHAFAHKNFREVCGSVTVLAWLMPSIVRELDGNYFHAAAFYLSVPILTGLFTHLQFLRLNPISIPFEMGASGVISAIAGAYAVVYGHEMLWLPFTPFRLRADTLVGLYAVVEIFRATRKNENRPRSDRTRHGAHVVGLIIGAAYFYFDGKERIWQPLTEWMSLGPKEALLRTISLAQKTLESAKESLGAREDPSQVSKPEVAVKEAHVKTEEGKPLQETKSMFQKISGTLWRSAKTEEEAEHAISAVPEAKTSQKAGTNAPKEIANTPSAKGQ